MSDYKTPELPVELLKRIKIVRRDFGNLLFHFTRAPEEKIIRIKYGPDHYQEIPGSASAVLKKILYEGHLKGTGTWSCGQPCICFTEAPMQELNSLFLLIDIAASAKERPRYEPYGIGVSKSWLYSKGGRPVIYDLPEDLDAFPEDLKYRVVPYDPIKGIDFSWEREWRIKGAILELDPKETLVVLPNSEEAFEMVYEFADLKADGDWDDFPTGVIHTPKWLAVSLDVFGFNR